MNVATAPFIASLLMSVAEKSCIQTTAKWHQSQLAWQWSPRQLTDGKIWYGPRQLLFCWWLSCMWKTQCTVAMAVAMHSRFCFIYVAKKKKNCIQARLQPSAINLSRLLAMISKVINSLIGTVVSCMSLIVSVHRYCTSYVSLVPGVHRRRKQCLVSASIVPGFSTCVKLTIFFAPIFLA